MTIKTPIPNKSRHLHLQRRASDKIDYNREKPTFCLRNVDAQYCITTCDQRDKAAFADKIRRLSCMTWNQIISADRHGMGFEKIPRESIRPSIPLHITEDTVIIAFRFSGMKPMVGYRSQSMFHIIWFDRDFNLYDHG